MVCLCHTLCLSALKNVLYSFGFALMYSLCAIIMVWLVSIPKFSYFIRKNEKEEENSFPPTRFNGLCVCVCVCVHAQSFELWVWKFVNFQLFCCCWILPTFSRVITADRKIRNTNLMRDFNAKEKLLWKWVFQSEISGREESEREKVVCHKHNTVWHRFSAIFVESLKWCHSEKIASSVNLFFHLKQWTVRIFSHELFFVWIQS